MLVCHGSCLQRIKRNQTYFVSNDGTYIWCHRCYSSLPQVISEYPNKPPLLKRNLLKAKSDEEVSEPWVECDTCHKWVHQVCALYNDRYMSAGDNSTDEMDGDDIDVDGDDNDNKKVTKPYYECPRCKLEARAMDNFVVPSSRGVQ